jgi:mRNA interferase MazF
MRRGEIWWASLSRPRDSAPGCRRPIVIVQSDVFNRSRITVELTLQSLAGSFIDTSPKPHQDRLLCVTSAL